MSSGGVQPHKVSHPHHSPWNLETSTVRAPPLDKLPPQAHPAGAFHPPENTCHPWGPALLRLAGRGFGAFRLGGRGGWDDQPTSVPPLGPIPWDWVKNHGVLSCFALSHLPSTTEENDQSTRALLKSWTLC